MPAGSAGDNAYQGCGLSHGFVWRAGPVSVTTPPAPAPVATAAPSATPPAGPVAAVDDASALGLPPAKTCVRRRRLTLKLKAPDRSMLASVTVAVNGRTKLRARGAKARKPLTLRACARSAPSR